ncbi:flagellar hook-associated protein 3 [Vibrio sp. HA2012]|uniref:flagellar hook-associated protein FlgL n=1 Tax=Vibrio sp. HA2012 TaxID=1971595 RepID=UPI000C2BDAF0|nr:flagellar hook-associated protein FlgL [Vibrio sp. HA2012]PJC86599.1 flagellar hook-associated protein 3 [Vibrio sp. HA2012]
MRISDRQLSQIMLNSLQTNNSRLGQVLQQMSTGDRLTKLSDDPITAVKLVNLERESSAISQYQDNIQNVKTTLSAQEIGLTAINSSLQSTRDLVLWGANGTLSDDDREGIIIQLRELQSAVVSSANSSDEEGHYLFSGTQTDVPAISSSAAGYNLDGNADKRMVTVAKGISMQSNLTAQDMFDLGAGNNVLDQLDRMIAEFENPTAVFDAEVESTLAAIDQTVNNVLGGLTKIGGLHNNLDLLDDSHADNKLFVDKVTSDISALDYAEASVRLSDYQAALEATQASYMKISELSLFDRI